MPVGFQGPSVGRFIKAAREDTCVETNIPAQIEAVGDMIDVTQDFRLRPIPLRPFPFLLQIIGEGIGIFHALYVATATRVTVPIPGAAHIAALFTEPDIGESGFLQFTFSNGVV